MSKVTQLTVSVENRPGTLARVARCLGNAGVNIHGCMAGTIGAAGYVQVIVDDPTRAKIALDNERLPYAEQFVLLTELPNKPGALADYCSRIADKNISITELFATTPSNSSSGSIVLACSDIEQAAQIQPMTATAVGV